MPAVNSLSFVSGAAVNRASLSARATHRTKRTNKTERKGMRGVMSLGGKRSGQDVLDDVSVDVRQALVAALMEVGQFLVIEAQAVQDGGVDVVDVGLVLDGLEAELVGGAVADAALDSAAGHPHREAIRVVIAARLTLALA